MLFTAAQTMYMVSVLLHHFRSVIKVLGMIVGSTNTVFIHMSELHLDPDCIKPPLMQNGTHGVPKAMTGSFAIVTDTFDHHVNTGFTYWFVDVATPWKYLGTDRSRCEAPAVLPELDQMSSAFLHAVFRELPWRIL